MDHVIEQCLYSIRVVADDCEAECEPDRARLLRTCARFLEDEIDRLKRAIATPNAQVQGPGAASSRTVTSHDGLAPEE